MHKNKYFPWRVVLSALFLGLLFSCESFYDAEVGDRITPDQHYNSSLDANLSYVGCFVYLQDIAEKQILVDGLRSDEMDVTGNADRDMIDINRHEFQPDNKYLAPEAYYKMIININEVLPNLPQILEKDRDFDSLTLDAYTGTLTTLRSWAYFNLAKINGQVGLVDGNLTNIDPSNPPQYLSKDQIIDRLISELLPFYDEEDIYRYSVDHYVLLGELYLEKNDYSNAAKFLKFACDGPALRNGYMVDAVYSQEAWQEIFMNSTAQGSTVITAVPYSFVDGQKNSLEEWFLYDYDYMVKPVDALVNSFKYAVQQNGDPGDIFRGVGISIDTATSGEAFIHKYSIDEGIPHSADGIIYRAADVHLMLAEALNRMGQSEYALVLLNNGFASMSPRPPEFVKWGKNRGVRARAYLQAKTVPAGTPNQVEYIEDLLLQERAIELAFEGKRFFDLIRIASRRNDPSYLANKVAAKFSDPATAEYVRSKLMNPNNWYIPIPRVGE